MDKVELLAKFKKNIGTFSDSTKNEIVIEIRDFLENEGYSIEEVNIDKPWGAYLRLRNSDAQKFITDFFSGLTIEEASLGAKDIQLSPKILIVSPNSRLSWQMHFRRAERWVFLTPGKYRRSLNDNQGGDIEASAGEVVQFSAQERHRLIGGQNGTLVAEIWQHTVAADPSDEDDIVRLQDDFER